jgi:integrase
MLKIRYSITIRNKNRKSAKWYGRIRQDGKERFLPMDSRADAERWLARQNYLYGEYTAGNAGEAEILTLGSTPVLAQKRASKAVLTLRECLDGWEKKRRLEGKREATLSAWGRALKLLVDPGMPVTEFGAAQVKAAIEARANLKAATRRFYSKALQSFVTFLRDEYGVQGLIEAIPAIKVDKATKPCWTREEMQRIISCIECRDKVVQEQFIDYCTIMAAIGSRQGETAMLRWEDYKDGCLCFRAENTKGRKERTVPVPMSVQERLAKRVQASGSMFPDLPRSQAGRFSMLRHAMERAGVKEGGLHNFRRAVSTLLYRECQDIKAVSQVLGHSAAVAIEHYQQTRGVEELRKVVEADLPKW